MDKRKIIVENVTKLNNVIQQTFQATQRLKLISFDVSKHYIIFGVSSGGLYIFDRRLSEFKKLIPSKGGTADIISISPNERNVALANSKGVVIILENCFTDELCRYQIYDEHEGQIVTALKWHDSDLYCGDSNGKVSVILSLNPLTKAIFQSPVATILHLDSPIVQIDTFHKHLLVSTKARTYLCDTENENFKPIGKKLRDGPFGACFLLGSAIESSSGCRSKFHRKGTNPSPEESQRCKVYCARPGARLWEATFEGEVIYTHQFRNTATTKLQSEVIVLTENPEAMISIADHSNSSLLSNFNFEKLLALCDRFILTFSKSGLFIIDPMTGTLLFWSNFYDNIQDVKVLDSKIFIWQNKQVFILSITSVEEIVLETLFHKQFFACAELCIKFSEDVIGMVDKSSKIHLIGALKAKLNESGNIDLLEKISPLLEKVQLLSQQKLENNNSGTGIRIVENAHYVEDEESSVDDINISDGILNFKPISLVGEKINEGTRMMRKNLQVLESKVKKLTSDSMGKNMSFRNNVIRTVPKKLNLDMKTIPKRNIELEKPNMPDLVEDINPDDLEYKLKIMLEQYKLNKVHKNVETTRVTRMLSRATLLSLKELHAEFCKHVFDTIGEDADIWCKGQFLKYVYKTTQHEDLATIENDLIEHLYECFCDFNNVEDSSCSCGYPLPKASKVKPLYHDIGLVLISNSVSDNMKITSKVPFMWGHHLNSLPQYDIFSNLPLIVQFNDTEILRKFSMYFSYDNWDDVIKLVIKLKHGYCLNCDKEIDNTKMMTWTEFGLLMLHYLGGSNTIKLLQLYGKQIPNGELNSTFYQACIFTTAVGGLESTFGSKPLELCLKASNKAATKIKLEKSLRSFLEKKYLEDSGEDRFPLPSINCVFCDMPINIDVLGHQVLKCSHFCHDLCLLYIDSVCILCNKM